MLCFFNLAGAVHDPDMEGYEVATLDDARVEAALSVAEVIRDRPNAVWAGEEIRMNVTDANRDLLFTVVVMASDAAAATKGPVSFKPKR